MSDVATTALRRNSLFSVAGFVVPTFVLLAFTPVLVRQLGAADYGLWSVSLAAFGLLNVLELGIGTALAKRIAEHSERGDVNAVSVTTTIGVLAYCAVGAFVTIPLFLASNSLSHLVSGGGESPARVASVIKLVSLGLIPLLLMSCGLAVAVGLQRFEIPMFLLMSQNVLTVVSALAVSLAGGSVMAVVGSSLAVLTGMSLVAMVIAARLLRRVGARPSLQRGYTRSVLSYVLLTGLTSLGALFFSSVDRLVVAAVLGLRAVTYYAVTIGVANKLLGIADVAARPLMPATSALVAAGDRAGARRFLRRGTMTAALGSGAVAIIGLLCSGPFLRLWMGEPFSVHALTSLRVLIVIYAVLGIAAPGYHVANGAGYAWICAVTAILGGAVAVALIGVLGSRWGLVGAAVANSAYAVTLAIPIYMTLALRDSGPG